jgi:lysophospholipase L1-like esterase
MLVLPSLTVTAHARPVRVACVGDSITQYSGYPGTLQSLLGKNFTVGNFGVTGSAVSPNSSKPYMNLAAFYGVLNFQPDVVVIMLGTNDANIDNYENVGAFQSSYEDLISKFQAIPGDQEIWLVQPPPIRNNQLNLDDTILSQDIIPKIEQAANDMGLPTVNVYSALSDYPEFFGDGVHPNSVGGQLIAEEIYQALSMNDANSSVAADGP